MKTISVVLTKYSDAFSTFVYYTSGLGYTHASIALNDDSGEMYSFNLKGFCIETIAKHRKRGVTKSICFHLNISDAAYERLRRRLAYMKEHRAQYSYTRFGVVMSYLRIPFARKNRYFCSQFVAEMLSGSGAMRLKKDASLYLPNHFCRELAGSRQLQRIQLNPV